MKRREFFLTAAAAAFASAEQNRSQLSVEGYIFEQYAQSRKQPVQSLMPEVLSMAHAAGFTNIELGPAFFPPEERDRTLSLLRAQRLRTPSLYVGGAMHEKDSADRTITEALELGQLCLPLGCRAIVNNPDPKHGDVPKTDDELAFQADALNRMGRTLAQHELELRVHHHTPQLAQNAREWRHILRNTDPQYVHICVDVDWAYEGNFEPIPFLREVGARLREVHVRSAKNKIWLEDLEDSDIDYRKVAEFLTNEKLTPLIVVELAYRPDTTITRPLEEDLRRSRHYAERIFANILTEPRA